MENSQIDIRKYTLAVQDQLARKLRVRLWKKDKTGEWRDFPKDIFAAAVMADMEFSASNGHYNSTIDIDISFVFAGRSYKCPEKLYVSRGLTLQQMVDKYDQKVRDAVNAALVAADPEGMARAHQERADAAQAALNRSAMIMTNNSTYGTHPKKT